MISQRTYSIEHYKIKLVKKNGLYSLYVPELCIVASSSTLEESYKILEAQFQKMIADYEMAEALDDLPKPTASGISDTRQKITLTTLKSIVVAAVFFITLFTSINFIENKLGSIKVAEIMKFQIKGVREAMAIWSNLNENKRDALLDELEVQLNAIKPIADRVSNVFASE